MNLRDVRIGTFIEISLEFKCDLIEMCKNEKSTQSHTRIQSKNADSLHEKKSS